MKQQSLHNSAPQLESDKLVKAIDRMFLGIVRLFMGRVTFDVLVERLRHAMVQEGSRRIARENGGKVVKSRVALLTGVKTEHIGRDLKEDEENGYGPGSLTVEARILNAWAREPAHLDPATGSPRPLHIYGSGDTFQRLVAIHAGRGVTPQTVLDSLISAGNVKIVDQHWVHLINPAWNQFTPDESDMLNGASFAVSNLLNTIQWNLEHFDQAEEKRLERNIWSVSLPPQQIPALRQRLNTVLKDYFETCRQEIKAHEDPNQTGYNSVLVGAGMFYWECDTRHDEFIPCSHPERRQFLWGEPAKVDSQSQGPQP